MEKTAARPAPSTDPEWMQIVTEKVQSLRFGVVQIVVHEGRVIQIERTEKVRLAPLHNAVRRDSLED
jgi:hypothetical protein